MKELNSLGGSEVEIRLNWDKEPNVFQGEVVGLLDFGTSTNFLLMKIKNDDGNYYEHLFNIENIQVISLIKINKVPHKEEHDGVMIQ